MTGLSAIDADAAVAQFAAALYDPSDVVEVRRLRGAQVRSSWYAAAALDETTGGLEADNANGWNVYAGANPRRAKGERGDAAVPLARVVFADFDDTTVGEALRRWFVAGLPAPTLVIASGHGVHIYLRLEQPATDLSAWRELQSDLAAALASDPKVRNPERVMRLPGFLNLKREPAVPCEIAECDPTRRAPWAAVRAPVSARPRKVCPRPAVAPPVNPGDRLKRCVAYMRTLPDAVSGQRGHDATYRAACEAWRFGLSDGEAWAALDWFNANKCQPAWTEREMSHKLSDARDEVGAEFGCHLSEPRPTGVNGHRLNVGAPERPDRNPGAVQPCGGANGDTGADGDGHDEPEPERPITAGELLDAYPTLRPPIVEKLLREGETANLIAAPKMRKSYLVTDLALAVVTGGLWLNEFQTHAGRVLVIDNELHRETLSSRLAQVARDRGLGRADFEADLQFHTLRGRLQDLYGLTPFLRRIVPGTYKLLILDALYRLLPADAENDNSAMAQFYNALDWWAERLRCAIVAVHHTSKGIQGGKSVTDTGAGAGAQSRAADAHAVMREHEEENCSVLEAVVRSWPPLGPIGLRWAYPRWHHDPLIDPSRLKVERGRGGRPRKERGERAEKEPPRVWTPEEFARDFIAEQAKPKTLVIAKAVQAGVPQREAARLLELAEDAKLIHQQDSGDRRKTLYASGEPRLIPAAPSGDICHARTPPHPPGAPRKKRGDRKK